MVAVALLGGLGGTWQLLPSLLYGQVPAAREPAPQCTVLTHQRVRLLAVVMGCPDSSSRISSLRHSCKLHLGAVWAAVGHDMCKR
jgi:hypothetical protein